MPRKIRFIIPQLPHHTLQRGNNRQTVFNGVKDKKYFLAQVRTHAKENKVAIGAYCLMTNHFHLLVYPDSQNGLVKFMKAISQNYSQYYNRLYKRTGKLWDNRYKLNIVEPEFEWVIARYIEKNPERAGIVKNAEEYPFSSGAAHLIGSSDISLSKDIIKGKTEEYISFFYEKEAADKKLLDRIRTVTQQQKVLGRDDFIKEIGGRFNANFEIRSRCRPAKEKVAEQ